jgi:hypothetical protein
MLSPLCFVIIRVRSSSALIVGSKTSVLVILLLNAAAAMGSAYAPLSQ